VRGITIEELNAAYFGEVTVSTAPCRGGVVVFMKVTNNDGSREGYIYAAPSLKEAYLGLAQLDGSLSEEQEEAEVPVVKTSGVAKQLFLASMEEGMRVFAMSPAVQGWVGVDSSEYVTYIGGIFQ
jgi:hypothetical protein